VILDDFAVGARQRSQLPKPFDDTGRHGTPQQHRSHHDISRLDVADTLNTARRSVDSCRLNDILLSHSVFKLFYAACVVHFNREQEKAVAYCKTNCPIF